MVINRIKCKIDYQQSARALGRELNLRVHESCLGSVKKTRRFGDFFLPVFQSLQLNQFLQKQG